MWCTVNRYSGCYGRRLLNGSEWMYDMQTVGGDAQAITCWALTRLPLYRASVRSTTWGRGWQRIVSRSSSPVPPKHCNTMNFNWINHHSHRKENEQQQYESQEVFTFVLLGALTSWPINSGQKLSFAAIFLCYVFPVVSLQAGIHFSVLDSLSYSRDFLTNSFRDA